MGLIGAMGPSFDQSDYQTVNFGAVRIKLPGCCRLALPGSADEALIGLARRHGQDSASLKPTGALRVGLL
jgi:hypothetical protein